MNKNNRSTLILLILAAVMTAACLAFGKPLTTANTLVLLQANNMTCSSCSQQISQHLTRQTGVTEVAVDVPAGLVEVAFDSRHVTPATLAGKVTALGFPATVAFVQPITPRASAANSTAPGGCNGKGGGCGGNCNKQN